VIAFAFAGVVATALLVLERRWHRARHCRENAATCHSCGESNPSIARFCRRCGERLTIDLCDETVPEER
jgi:predicted amidophosphoribosyltransferase